MTTRLLALMLLAACGAPEGSTGTVAEGTSPETTEPTPSDPGETTGEAASCEGITPEVIEITPDELADMLLDKDFELVNVHIPYEGELPDTDAHIAYTETDELEAYLGHDKAAKAVLYCRTGPMSAKATADLVERGYCRIYDLPAGMVGWENDGYELLP